MSKFIDYLSRIGDPTPVPMGFGPVKSKERQPSILLVGSIQLTKLANKPESASVPVDSVIIEATEFEEDLLDKAISKIGNTPWGVRTGNLTDEQLDLLISKGCDFVIFGLEQTNISLFDHDDLGKIFAIQSGIERDCGRAIDTLPIDAVIIEGVNLPKKLSVEDLLNISKDRTLLGFPCLLSGNRNIEDEEIKILRDMQISGIINSLGNKRRIQKSISFIDSLTPQKRAQTSHNALIPQSNTGFKPGHDEESEDEDWE